MPKKKQDKFILAVQMLEAQSYKGYAECFQQIADFFKKNPNEIITDIKVKHDGSGHRIKLFLLKDVVEPKVTKSNKLAIGMSIVDI